MNRPSGAASAVTPREKALRIAAGVTAGVGSLVLTLVLVTAPERLGLSPSPALFARVRATDRGVEAVLVVWVLIAMPLAGLSQTPVAWLRRARIGAGWALLAGQWLIAVLVAVAVWQAEGLFPAADSSGKNGGLFGGALLVLLGVPLLAVCSGSVFLRDPGEDGRRVSEQVRAHLAGTALFVLGLGGAVAGLLCGASFGCPAAGAAAMFLPGGLLWGCYAGITLGALINAALLPALRPRTLAAAASFARTATALLGSCLLVAQLGWFLPALVMIPLGIGGPLCLIWLAGRYGFLADWVELRTVDPPERAFT